MKKVYFLGALTGLMMASCANDDLVVKPAPAAGEGGGAITFTSNVGNQSRAELQTVVKNFGVWAIKANGVSDLTSLTSLNLGAGHYDGTYSEADKLHEQVVMDDYKVWYDATNEAYGSHWTYEDTNLPQYLKYWDGSYRNTYFFAYAPHNSVSTATADVTFTNGATPYLTFSNLLTTSDEDYNFIYADAVEADNSTYITGDNKNPKKVPLHFHRIMSQVKIAFWESIPGYTVEIEGIDQVDNNAKFGSGDYVAAIPADYTAAAATPSTANTWTRGGYNSEGMAKVEYSGTSLGTTELSYYDVVRTDGNIYFTAPAGELGKTRDDAVPSADVYNVLPNKATMSNITMKDKDKGVTNQPNSGLQFVVNYVLKAEDTNEEIHVKGARVYVPAAYTAWAPNTVYTYYFQITKDSSGTTTSTDPTNEPAEPYDALYPIIFDNVTIDDINKEESNWVINQNITLNPSKIGAMKLGATGTIKATLQYLVDDNTNQTVYWTTSDKNVVSITADSSVANASGEASMTIEAKSVGTATITATNNGITAICTITVVPAP